MDRELGVYYNTTFTNPDEVRYAEILRRKGYRISSAGELLPTPRTALGEEGGSIPRLPRRLLRDLRLTDVTRLPRDPRRAR
jgi:acetolactate synthase-1/2/3 large subunit